MTHHGLVHKGLVEDKMSLWSQRVHQEEKIFEVSSILEIVTKLFDLFPQQNQLFI